MDNSYIPLDRQIANTEDSLRLIEERKSEYVESTEMPLQLVREERKLRKRLEALLTQRERLKDIGCPYRGMEVFSEEHAQFYCGRTEMIAQLIRKVRLLDFVAVVGVSGSGKSSLVRAGLVSALRNGALLDSSAWRIDIFRPGADPLTSLASVLVGFSSPHLSTSDTISQTRRLADGILAGKFTVQRDVLPRLQSEHPKVPHYVLAIDQFEEIFDPQVDTQIRQKFIQAITQEGTANWLKIVITLRANYFDAILQEQHLRERVVAGQLTVLPMNVSERREAIELPALKAGRTFEPGLVERMLDDLHADAGELPLLEFAMTQLWQRQTTDGVMTHDAYEKIGTVSGAIARHASDVFTSSSPDQQARIEKLCKRLVRINSEESQAEKLLAEASLRRINLGDLDPAYQTLVHDVLSYQRLVITGRNESTHAETVELVHEALVRNWPQFGQWLVEDAPNLRVQQALAEAVQIWERYGRSPEFLYDGRRLQEASTWRREHEDALTSKEAIFLDLSVRTRVLSQRRRIVGIVALVAIFGGLIAGVVYGFLPDQPDSMPANHFNIAVADFGVDAPPDTEPGMYSDLRRAAQTFARQIGEDLQRTAPVLEADIFNDDVTIWGPDQFSIQMTEPISVQQTMKQKNMNLLIYGEIIPGQGRYWGIQPYFVVNDSVFSNRVRQVLAADQVSIGAPISFIPGNQQSIKETEQQILARLQTLGQLLNGLAQYDLGTEEGYRRARRIFCPADMNELVTMEGHGSDMLLLYCGNANSMLASGTGKSDPEYHQLVMEGEAAYRTGLTADPGDARLQLGLAAILLNQVKTTDFTCIDGTEDVLREAIARVDAFFELSESADSIPLSSEQEAHNTIGQAHFWLGLCFDSESLDEHLQQAEQHYQTTVELSRTAEPRTRYSLFAAGAAEQYYGHLLYLRSMLSSDPTAIDQFRNDALTALSNSVSDFLEIGDEESVTNAEASAYLSISLQCFINEESEAAATLDRFSRLSAMPQEFRRQVLAMFPPELLKGCGL